jgi:hypothetical protein
MEALSIGKSMDGMMAKANSCFPTTSKNDAKRQWMEGRELYLGNISGVERVLTPVYFDTDMYKKVFLMDCITGTLFMPNGGKCLTSDQLHMHQFVRQNDLDKKLLKIKGYRLGGDE